MGSDENWMDWDAGPVARPYTVTGGRTRPRGDARLDLIDVVARTGAAADAVLAFTPERLRILQLCGNPVTVADLASAVGLPVGVVRVVLADLVHEGLIRVTAPAARGRMTDSHLLRQVLDGLNSL
jgi:hypothetical protein